MEKQLEIIKQHLKRNLSKIIDRERLQLFDAVKFLEMVLVQSGRQIVAHDLSMVKNFANDINVEYILIIENLRKEICEGNIIGLKSYIHNSVNGSFTFIINEFLKEYDKHNKEYRN